MDRPARMKYHLKKWPRIGPLYSIVVGFPWTNTLAQHELYTCGSRSWKLAIFNEGNHYSLKIAPSSSGHGQLISTTSTLPHTKRDSDPTYRHLGYERLYLPKWQIHPFISKGTNYYVTRLTEIEKHIHSLCNICYTCKITQIKVNKLLYLPLYLLLLFTA